MHSRDKRGHPYYVPQCVQGWRHGARQVHVLKELRAGQGVGCALRAGLEPRWAEGVVSEGPMWTGDGRAEQEGEKEGLGVPGWCLLAQNRNPPLLGPAQEGGEGSAAPSSFLPGP